MDPVEARDKSWELPFIKWYVGTLHDVCGETLRSQREALVPLRALLRSRSEVLVLGNGGSSAIARVLAEYVRCSPTLRAGIHASHPVESFIYQTGGDYGETGRRIVSNLQRLSLGGALYISGSGNSSNLVSACRESLLLRIPTFAILGAPGGALAHLADVPIRISTQDQQIMEDAAHLLCVASCRRDENFERLMEALRSMLARVQRNREWVSLVVTDVVVAALEKRNVHLVASGDPAVSLSVEHFAHNLMWDLTHKLALGPLGVVWGTSEAQMTAVLNDTDDARNLLPSYAMRIHEKDVLLSFVSDARLSPIDQQKYGAGWTSYQWAAAGIGEMQDSLTALEVQVLGHIVVRMARAVLYAWISGSTESPLSLSKMDLAPLRGTSPVQTVEA